MDEEQNEDEFEVTQFALDFNGIVGGMEILEGIHHNVHHCSTDPEDNLFLTVTSQELGLIFLGLHMVMMGFPCLGDETIEFLEDKLQAALEIQKPD